MSGPVPGGLRAAIAIGKKRGISDSDRAQLVFGVGKVMKEFEAGD